MLQVTTALSWELPGPLASCRLGLSGCWRLAPGWLLTLEQACAAWIWGTPGAAPARTCVRCRADRHPGYKACLNKRCTCPQHAQFKTGKSKRLCTLGTSCSFVLTCPSSCCVQGSPALWSNFDSVQLATKPWSLTTGVLVAETDVDTDVTDKELLTSPVLCHHGLPCL
jgi:hypothetical protein